ncbi:MAG: FG-GAP-like repeat-containing protein [Candidatus Cloacimonetes bacterium]|nr:FG-GAP-like repeat-containing protein [Candidatus Cloacimonadota bacterium]
MRVTAIFLILMLLGSILNAMENEFLMHEITGEYAEGTEISSLDFDGDGDFDLLSAGTDCTLWLNDGNGDFSASVVYENGNLPRSIRAANLDNDDDIDIVLAELYSNRVVILENQGNYYDQIFLTNIASPHTIDLKDLDQDGLVDILCCEFDFTTAPSAVVWWQNLGNMQFSSAIIISEMFQQSTYVFADYINSDDYLDVVASGELNSDVVWWANDGAQNFGDPFFIDEFFNRSHTLIGNDLDQDDDIDVLGAACLGGLLAWWENNGEGDFTRHDLDTFGGALWLDAADFDNDGDKDLYAVGQGASYAEIYENTGEEIFTEYPLPGIFNDGYSATANDFDNDGDIDLAAIGRSSHQICWWENMLYAIQFSGYPQTGHFPLLVQFSDDTNLLDPVTSRAWDFDSDGIIDSTDQNPVFTYPEAGIFTVSLTVTTASMVKTVTYEDYIQIFNGESALAFTGDSFLECPPAPALNITGTFTFETWINPESYGSVTNIGLGRIFDKSAFSLYLLDASPVYNDHSLIFEFQNASGTLIRCNTPENSVNIGYWQHIAVSYDGFSDVQIYIDGMQTTLTNSEPPTGNIADNAYSPLFMGISYNLSWGFCGLLDELRLWNDVRTSVEIQNKMFYHLTGNEAGLAACWQLNEGNGEIAPDITLNGNDAAINSATWIEGIELVPAAGEETSIPQNENIISFAYPNPFNPVTTITFQLPATAKITLKIYNLKGQKVTTLLNDTLSAGIHHITWNSKDTPTGIYLYQLNINEKTISGKLSLIK